MQTISDNPNQHLQEARAKLRDLLTEYVAADLHKVLEKGGSDMKESIDSAMKRMVLEMEGLRKQVKGTMDEHWDNWNEHWKKWREITDQLPLKLREQFIDDLTAQLEQHRAEMLAWYETLSYRQEQFQAELSKQLAENEEQALQRESVFFQSVGAAIEQNNKKMQELRDAIDQQQREWTASLQELKEIAMKSLEALPEKLAALEAAQVNQEIQIARLLEQADHHKILAQKNGRYLLATLVVVILVLLVVSLLQVNRTGG